MAPTDGLDLTGPEAEELLRPAAELAIEMARAGTRLKPPADVPTRIRPLLRHAKLTRAALVVARRVLEEDAAFRARVAHAAGMPTAEETLGRASVLWLCRPPGWEVELGTLVESALTAAGTAADGTAERSAQRRLRHAEEARDRATRAAEVAGVTAEEARAELNDERRQRRAAEVAAAKLERRVMALEEQLLSSRRAAEGAVKRLADWQEVFADAVAVKAAMADEQRRLQGEVAAARAAASSLVEALGRLASALDPPTLASPVASEGRSGLPEAPLRVSGTKPRWARQQPRGAHRHPARLPPLVHDDSPEAAVHLVNLPGVALLVDGYNMTLSTWPGLPLPEQRLRLIDALSELAARTGARPEVVFDGVDVVAESRLAGSYKSLVKIVFTAADVEADDVIIARAHHLPLPVVVASDDRRVREGATAGGANVLGIGQLLAALRRTG